jgi:predicted patatin/cPLA2 family phospholipase
MLTPISIEGQLWSDGGLRSVTPLGEAIRAGADEVDIIMCSDPYAKDSFSSKGKAAIPSLALRAIDILTDEIMRADLKICGLKNDLVEAGGPYKKVVIRRVLSPSVKLVDNDLDFSQSTIKRMMKIGYEDACKNS